MGAPQQVTNDFFFADELTLDESQTRRYYESVLRGLTHKSNNFLAVVQGFSTLILMQDALDPQIRENLGHIKEAGQGASNLYDRTLLCGGCSTVTIQEIQLNEYMPLAEGDFRKICEENGVAFGLNMVGPGIDSDPMLAFDSRSTSIRVVILPPPTSSLRSARRRPGSSWMSRPVAMFGWPRAGVGFLRM